MGIVYLDEQERAIYIKSEFILYGDAATDELAETIASDIQLYWNQPQATVSLSGREFSIRFILTGRYNPQLSPEEVWYNDHPSMNFFRIEEYCAIDISFVDGIGSNTGYFRLANLLQTGTTAAHEYGHTLGLDHPAEIDIRGQGRPGIMYPRGTITDPEFLYNPLSVPGDNTNGGTMNPDQRRVTSNDIHLLKLHRLSFSSGKPVLLGDFSSAWHDKH